MSVSGRLDKSFYIHTVEQNIFIEKEQSDLKINKEKWQNTLIENIKLQKQNI